MKSLSIKDIPYDGPLSNEDTVYCTTYIETSEIRPSLNQPASRPGPIVSAIERTNALYKCIRSSPCNVSLKSIEREGEGGRMKQLGRKCHNVKQALVSLLACTQLSSNEEMRNN